MKYINKVNTSVLPIAIAIFIVIISGCGTKPGEKDGGKPDETTGESHFDYNVTADIENFSEETVEIVTLSMPAYDKDYVAENASRFGLSGSAEEINGVYSIKSGELVYSLDSLTGLEDFGNLEKSKWETIKAPQVPTEEEATKIAIDFINSLKETETREREDGLYSENLLIIKPDTPEEARVLKASTTALVPVQVNEVVRSAVEVNDELEPVKEIIDEQVISRTVVLNKYYNGKPVFSGPGSRVTVTIGNNGEVIHYGANWFPVNTEKRRTVEVVKSDNAIKDLETKLRASDKKIGAENKMKKVDVKSAIPGYISASVDGEYTLVPVYYFDCESELENGGVFSFTEIIVAAPELEDKIELGFDIPEPEKPEPIKEKPGD